MSTEVPTNNVAFNIDNSNTEMSNMDTSNTEILNESTINRNDNGTSAANMRKTMTYSRVTAETNPGRDHAISIDPLAGVPKDEYAYSVGRLIGPQNVLSVNRSSGKVIIFVSSTELVDKLTDKDTELSIGDQILKVKPLVPKTKRVIISDVCLSLPNSEIETKFRELGFSTKSLVTTLRAGLKDLAYAHVLSHRRQIYIDQQDIMNLPKSMNIQYQGLNHLVYVSIDNPACYTCKRVGHFSQNCPNKQQQQQSQGTSAERGGPSNNNTQPPKQTEHTSETPDPTHKTKTSPSLDEIDSTLMQPSTDAEELNTFMTIDRDISEKRALSEDSLADIPSLADAENPEDEFVTPGPLKKRAKKGRGKLEVDFIKKNSTRLSKNFNELKETHGLKYIDFVQLVYKLQREDDLLPLIEVYTQDATQLEKFLLQCYPYIDSAALKGRITGICSRLENPDYESDSQASQTI